MFMEPNDQLTHFIKKTHTVDSCTVALWYQVVLSLNRTTIVVLLPPYASNFMRRHNEVPFLLDSIDKSFPMYK